jgi:hypothetical protein
MSRHTRLALIFVSLVTLLLILSPASTACAGPNCYQNTCTAKIRYHDPHYAFTAPCVPKPSGDCKCPFEDYVSSMIIVENNCGN